MGPSHLIHIEGPIVILVGGIEERLQRNLPELRLVRVYEFADHLGVLQDYLRPEFHQLLFSHNRLGGLHGGREQALLRFARVESLAPSCGERVKRAGRGGEEAVGGRDEGEPEEGAHHHGVGIWNTYSSPPRPARLSLSPHDGARLSTRAKRSRACSLPPWRPPRRLWENKSCWNSGRR